MGHVVIGDEMVAAALAAVDGFPEALAARASSHVESSWSFGVGRAASSANAGSNRSASHRRVERAGQPLPRSAWNTNLKVRRGLRITGCWGDHFMAVMSWMEDHSKQGNAVTECVLFARSNLKSQLARRLLSTIQERSQ